MSIKHKIYHKLKYYRNRTRVLELIALDAKVHPSVRSYGRFTVANIPNLEIGKNSYINEGVHLNCLGKVIIGKNVHLSTNVQIHTSNLEISRGERSHLASPVIVSDNVWLASGVIVLPGVTIGKNSIIGAGSVVTKDIAPNSVAVGIPARVIREIEE